MLILKEIEDGSLGGVNADDMLTYTIMNTNNIGYMYLSNYENQPDGSIRAIGAPYIINFTKIESIDELIRKLQTTKSLMIRNIQRGYAEDTNFEHKEGEISD